MMITESLHSAFWQLRQEEHQGYIWADAVCINQTDLEEKNQQVRRMVDIYKGADLVLVWLGEEGDEEVVGYNFLCDIVKAVKDVDEQRSSDNSFIHLTSLLGMFSVHGCSAMMRLLNKPWFTRAWVVQEYWAATARRFQCGQLKMDPEMLMAFRDIYINHYDLKWAFTAHNTRSSAGRTSGGLGPFFVFDDSMASNNMALVRLLQMCAGLKSTDPRDQIFALVGLSSERNTKIIDYGTEISYILRRISVDYICSRDSSIALNILSIISRSDEEAGLPTWVATYARTNGWLPLVLIYSLPRTLTKASRFSFGSKDVRGLSGQMSHVSTA